MLKNILILLALICFSGLQAQETNSSYKTKKIPITRDTIHLEKTSINSSHFKLLDANEKPIDSTFYKINFEKGTLILNKKIPSSSDSLTVHYLKLPESLTKEYHIYDDSKVVSNEAVAGSLYKIEGENLQKKNAPFEGLNTSGSITRGVTIGNNQNSVLNSNLDLQITGKLSEKVSLRASLQDNNIPLQDGGYSQKLDQFDNVFMELF
ncbi:MAG: hypothetical protein C0430_11795, partial [Flavobacterium sp.]|nr:hypothetical protein [Flavobacterium sp.]